MALREEIMDRIIDLVARDARYSTSLAALLQNFTLSSALEFMENLRADVILNETRQNCVEKYHHEILQFSYQETWV